MYSQHFTEIDLMPLDWSPILVVPPTPLLQIPWWASSFLLLLNRGKHGKSAVIQFHFSRWNEDGLFQTNCSDHGGAHLGNDINRLKNEILAAKYYILNKTKKTWKHSQNQLNGVYPYLTDFDTCFDLLFKKNHIQVLKI